MSRANLDAAIVGGGLAGVYMLHRLRKLGMSARVFEAGSGIGGTWYWNRYPGARCDIESMEYSYQFSDELQQEWEWSERYASQPEILKYINHVADRFELRDGIQLNTRVTQAVFDEDADLWTIAMESPAGSESVSARFCIMATGCLSSRNMPDFPGLDTFEGEWHHTGNWPHEGVDFSGKRVGVIGTGSSAIQAVPLIAAEVDHLTVFQRTPNYSIPAHNGPIDPDLVRAIKEDYAGFRRAAAEQPFGANFPYNDKVAADCSSEEIEAEYERRWSTGGLGFMAAYEDLLSDPEVNRTAQDFIRDKIRQTVQDPAVAEKLLPATVVGCKRLCIDTGYYKTYNRPNVELVDVSRTPIEEINATGLRVDGRQYDFDALVFATGFDAMTGALLAIDIRGIGGKSLREKWSAGPRTYLGLATAGFPNLFTITGPGSPSVLSNMIPSIEQHANWIADCVAYLRDQGLSRIDASVDAEDAWVEHVNEVAGETLFPSCNSWYLGANVPGKPRVFMPYLGFPPYVEKCNEVAAKAYEGFALA